MDAAAAASPPGGAPAAMQRMARFTRPRPARTATHATCAASNISNPVLFNTSRPAISESVISLMSRANSKSVEYYPQKLKIKINHFNQSLNGYTRCEA